MTIVKRVLVRAVLMAASIQRDQPLIDIGEEFHHILYHVRDPEFYAYLRDGAPTAFPGRDEPPPPGATRG